MAAPTLTKHSMCVHNIDIINVNSSGFLACLGPFLGGHLADFRYTQNMYILPSIDLSCAA